MEACKIVKTVLNGKMVMIRYPDNEGSSVTMERVRKNENPDSQWPLCRGRIVCGADTYEEAQKWLAAKNNGGPSNQEDTKRNDLQMKMTKKSPKNRIFRKKEKARELRVVLERIPADKLLQLKSKGRSKTTTTKPTTTNAERDEATEEEGCDDEMLVTPIFEISGDVVGFCVSDSSGTSDTSSEQEDFPRVPSSVAVSADLFQIRATPRPVYETENGPGPSQSSRIPQVPQSSRQMPGLIEGSPDLVNNMLRQKQIELMNDLRNRQRFPHTEPHQMSGPGPMGPFHQQQIPYEPAPHQMSGPRPMGAFHQQQIPNEASPHQTSSPRPIGPFHQQQIPYEASPHQMSSPRPTGLFHQQQIPHEPAPHQMSGPRPMGPFRPQPIRYETAPIQETCQLPSIRPRHQSSVIQPPPFQHNVHLPPQQNQIHPCRDGNHIFVPVLVPVNESVPASEIPHQPAENLEEDHQEDQEDTVMQQMLRYADAIESETGSISQNLNNVLQTVLELKSQQSQLRSLYLRLIGLLHTRRQH